MSDSQEKSDDLIAELARLMASNAGASEGEPKPGVIKLPPLGEATIKATPVRIPGMDPAPAPSTDAPQAPQAAAAPPAVRIPGMERPAGVDVPPPAPKPAAQFDFGKPPAAAPVVAPEPMSNWQTREAPKLSPAPPPKPAAVAHLAELKFDPVKPLGAEPPKPAAAAPRVEPKAAPVPGAQAPGAAPPASARPADSFGFDFGFGKPAQGQQTPTPANDPIADLIVAEMDGSKAGEAEGKPAQSAEALHAEVIPNPLPPKPVAAAPVRPAIAAARPADSDRFGVAPVFAGKPATPPAPAPTARAAEVDPIEEIENLIGEAVRVELSTPEKPITATPAPNVAPVVPPLGSGFTPRRANVRENEPQVQSAEEAILAAAAASGADVGHVEAPVSDERPYKRMKVKPPRTSFVSSGARQYVGIAVAGTLLLAAGFGLYWVLGMGGRDDPATAPVLTADAGPVKVEPAISAANAAEPSGSVVFDEINGNTTVDDAETLVSRDETAGATPVEVARAVTPASDDSNESGLANRKVRTVTVRPDGTIVPGDEAVAGTEELPVDRPNVPELPGEEMEPSDLLTAAVAETRTVADATNATQPPDAIAALVSDTGEATTEPVAETAPLDVASVDGAQATPQVFDASLKAPIPMPRPADRASMVGSGSSVREASASAIAPARLPLVDLEPQQPQAQVSSSGGAYVQLSSQRSEGDAQASLRTLQNRMSGMLNGASLEVRRVDLPSKGVWYRVVLPRSSFQDATQTCAAIKSGGFDCVAISG